MKLLLYILIALLLFACSKDNDGDAPPQPIDTLGSGWKKIQIATPDQINDIFFINNNTGYAISRSAIFRSTDGGDHWSQVYQTNKTLFNIAMGNQNNAMFTSASNTVLFTNNGGLSFDSIELAAKTIDDIFFVGESTAYAVGEKTWKTVNAGKNWTSLYAFSPNQNDNLSGLFFLDEQTGWVTGNGFFKTSNGGVTWTNIPGSITGFGRDIGNVFFPTTTTGYMTSAAAIFKTSDGGSSFTRIFDAHVHHYHDIHFFDAETGYYTDGRYVLKTINGGQTWTKDVVLAQGELVELHFTDPSHGWAGGWAGLILKYEP
jgi:photosystem II stability/assembly factor-like uncharacterized protein